MFVFFVGFVGYSQSLEDYIKIAIENNPGLKSAKLSVEAELQKIPQVSSLPDPTLTMSSFGSMIETSLGPQVARFTLSQMFPWFGTLKLQKEKAALDADASLQLYLNRRNELISSVKETYYKLNTIDKTIEYQKENFAILKTFKQLALSKFQNGKGSMVDVLKVDLMLNEMETEIAILEENRKPIQVEFNKMLNRSEFTPIVISDILKPEKSSLDKLIKPDFASNPQLTSLDLKIQSAEKEEKLAHKMGLPDLMVGIEYNVIGIPMLHTTMMDAGKDAYMPMVSVSLPIFRKKYKAAKREAELMKQSMESMKNDVQNMLQTEYEMALTEVNTSFKMMQLYEKQQLSTQQALDLSIMAYSNATLNIDDILMLQQQQIQYKIKIAAAIQEYYTAMAQLDYLTAKLN